VGSLINFPHRSSVF